MRTLTRALVALVAVLATVLAGSMAPATASQARSSGHHHHKVGYTQVTVAPAVYELVAGAGITPSAIAPAVAFPTKGTLAARFPITGYSPRNLTIKHSGGITLSAGAATISLKRFDIELARLRVTGVVSGSAVNAPRVPLFKIRASDRYDLGLVRLTLTDVAAGALNGTFGVDAFSAGDTFGYATPRPFGRIDARWRAALRR
jgi:hypothetical protein